MGRTRGEEVLSPVALAASSGDLGAMRYEELPAFRAALAEIRSLPGDARAPALADLFRRHAFASRTTEVRSRKRRCRVPALTLADLSRSQGEARVEGYVRAAWVPSGGSREIVWCPALNTLILEDISWTGEDTYLRIRSQKVSRYSLLDEAEAVALVLRAWG
jgi:hypothetical protein